MYVYLASQIEQYIVASGLYPLALDRYGRGQWMASCGERVGFGDSIEEATLRCFDLSANSVNTEFLVVNGDTEISVERTSAAFVVLGAESGFIYAAFDNPEAAEAAAEEVRERIEYLTPE